MQTLINSVAGQGLGKGCRGKQGFAGSGARAAAAVTGPQDFPRQRARASGPQLAEDRGRVSEDKKKGSPLPCTLTNSQCPGRGIYKAGIFTKGGVQPNPLRTPDSEATMDGIQQVSCGRAGRLHSRT